jgi:regulator of nonsense transcripts 2
LDLADDVPPTFLGLKTNGEPEQPSAEDAAVQSPEGKPESLYSDVEESHQDDKGQTDTNGDKEEGLGLEGLKKLNLDDGDPLQSGPAARLSAVFAALPEANNRTVIDKLAVDFAYLNSKAARKRCIKVCNVVCCGLHLVLIVLRSPVLGHDTEK